MVQKIDWHFTVVNHSIKIITLSNYFSFLWHPWKILSTSKKAAKVEDHLPKALKYTVYTMQFFTVKFRTFISARVLHIDVQIGQNAVKVVVLPFNCNTQLRRGFRTEKYRESATRHLLNPLGRDCTISKRYCTIELISRESYGYLCPRHVYKQNCRIFSTSQRKWISIN